MVGTLTGPNRNKAAVAAGQTTNDVATSEGRCSACKVGGG